MDDLAALEQMKRFGVSIYRLSPEQLKAFREKMQPVYEVYTKRYGSAVTEFLNACKSVQ